MKTVDTNVIYGMYSGLALLMDVYYPEQPNGYGIIYISGSGFHAPLAYGAAPLKASPQVKVFMEPLRKAGYTVFAINHRAAPRFKYPAAIEDAQRSVRFVRYHAKEFGINPDSIGAAGGSSGGYLVSMLALLDGKGNPQDEDLVNQQSASVQCVMVRAAPSDFIGVAPGPEEGGYGLLVDFMGMFPREEYSTNCIEYRTYVEASPITHVSPDAPPFLLIHGEQDQTVLVENSECMFAALQKARVPSKLVMVAGAGHGHNFPGATQPPEFYLGEMVCWFDQHLANR